MNVSEAYDFCRRVAHKHGANFSVGFRFLPPAKRRAVYATYAFCRWADDIADEVEDSLPRHPERERGTWAVDGAMHLPTTQVPRSARDDERFTREALDAWQHELDLCYSGSPTHPITIALADSLQKFDIPKSAFIALIDGCRQDTWKRRYETFDELLQYCELVASSISDLSLPIFGYKSDVALDYGRKLSTALQLTNVTRDVGDDLGRDRIYIPREELQRFGVTEEELFARAENDRMRRLIEFQIDRAEGYFRAAEPLLDELEWDARFPTILMGGIYATVLAKLRKDPLVVVRRRLSLTVLQKLMVVGARVLRPHFV